MPKIRKDVLQKQFDLAEIDKEELYSALRFMGTKHLKTKKFKEQWSEENPTKNYCYVVAEFLWFYVAPTGSKPYSLRVPGDDGLHRFVKWPCGTVIDLSVEQFSNYEDVDYTQARVRYPLQTGCTGPSKRARLLASLMGYNEDDWRNPDGNKL